MLAHFLRNLTVVLRALRKPKVDWADGKSTLDLRVRLADLDYNLHMNNARYLDVFELGRVDAIVRNGMLAAAFRHRLFPIVASVQVRYMAELKYRDRFTVETYIGGWDDRWMWIEQSLVRARDGKVCARALFRAQFRTKLGPFPPAQMLRECGAVDVPDKLIPPAVENYALAEGELHRALSAGPAFRAVAPPAKEGAAAATADGDKSD